MGIQRTIGGHIANKMKRLYYCVLLIIALWGAGCSSLSLDERQKYNGVYYSEKSKQVILLKNDEITFGRFSIKRVFIPDDAPYFCR